MSRRHGGRGTGHAHRPGHPVLLASDGVVTGSRRRRNISWERRLPRTLTRQTAQLRRLRLLRLLLLLREHARGSRHRRRALVSRVNAAAL